MLEVREGAMRLWQLAVVGLACLATAGCRATTATALLEQENCELEGQVYELAGLVEECRQENARLRERLKRCEVEADVPVESPEPPALPDLPGPEALETPGNVPPPVVELPSEGISGEEFLKRFSERNAPPPDGLPAAPGAETPAPAPKSPPAPPGSPAPQDNRGAAADRITPGQADNTRIEAITLDARLTGGYDSDGNAGHEGIAAVVEPRDAEGRLVAAAAPMSVVVLDPAMSGEAARVARWDLTAEEVAKRCLSTPQSGGIRLDLPWPRVLPVHNRLHLFVRYVTDDGRNLEADTEINIEVPVAEALRLLPPRGGDEAPKTSEQASRWQPRKAQATPLPAAKPTRTALVPREPEQRTEESRQQEAPPSSPSRRRPVWSPDRL